MRKILGSVGYAAAVVMLVPALTLAASFFYVADDGSIGIGTSSPLHKLDVVGAIYSRLVTLSSSSTVAVNWNSGNVQTVTLGTSPTLTFSNGQAGGEYKLILKQDSTGGRTVTWPSTIKWEDATAPTLSVGANTTDVISFLYDGTSYLGSYAMNYASSTVVDYLVVAGGGGGGISQTGSGGNATGGGGAGGVKTGSGYIVAPGAYTVTVGAGGGAHTTGSDSVFDTITAHGGGAGGNGTNSTGGAALGGNGGSGGGGGFLVNAGGSPTGSEGYAGGTGVGGYSGAGGGAGGAGDTPGTGGIYNSNGGVGIINPILGSTVGQNVSGTYYLAGGGGGGVADGTATATGGYGGGGTGAPFNTSNTGGAGTANTGGGGGGANGNNASGGAGGSGVVVIRYPTGTISATGGTITTSGGYTIHTFTSSGTFTVN